MLKEIVNSSAVFWAMGIFTITGILCKCITQWNLKRMIKAAGNIGKSTHRLMKLVKAKFEHTCMINDRVENIKAFVEKYLFEYRICGLSLHAWGQLQKTMVSICVMSGIFGAAGSYVQNGMGEEVFRYLSFMGICVISMHVIYFATDEKYQTEIILMYMTEYLENTYAPKFQKTAPVLQERKQERKPVEKEEATEEKEEEKEEIQKEENEKGTQEIVLREIIEEFLA